MSIPALPEEGKNWIPWATALDTEARTIAGKQDAASLAAATAAHVGDGSALDDALRAAFVSFNSDGTINGTLRAVTYLGVGAGIGSARMPFFQNSIVNGTAFTNVTASGGADDYVGHQVNVKFEGGFDHLIQTRTGGMTSGSATLTLTSGTLADPITVGYHVVVPGAGPSGGTLKATITAITDTTHATLSSAASTTVAGAAVTASLAPDPTFVFGANDYFITGTVAGDLDGIKNMYGRLIETHASAPGTNLDVMKVLQVEGHLEAEAVGGHIGTFFGLHILAPRNGGTIDTAYGLYIDAPTAATANYGLYVSGSAPVHFDGRLDFAGDLRHTGTVFNCYAGATQADSARLELRANAVDGFARLYLPGGVGRFQINNGTSDVIELNRTGDIIARSVTSTAQSTSDPAVIARGVSGQTANILRVQDSNTNDVFAVTAAGLPRWSSGFNSQTTVGAAGGASSLPATPTKYLKVVDSAGTTLVIPAYAA